MYPCGPSVYGFLTSLGFGVNDSTCLRVFGLGLNELRDVNQQSICEEGRFNSCEIFFFMFSLLWGSSLRTGITFSLTENMLIDLRERGREGGREGGGERERETSM